MELEEAIELLNKFMNNEMQRDKLERDYRCGGWKIGDVYKHLELNQAIETVLQELEYKDEQIDKLYNENIELENYKCEYEKGNLIPKKKIEDKVKELNKGIKKRYEKSR